MSIVEYTRTRAYCLVLVTIRNISRGYNVVKMPVYSWLFATITSTSIYAKHSVHPRIIATATAWRWTDVTSRIGPHLIQRTITSPVYAPQQIYLYANEPL